MIRGKAPEAIALVSPGSVTWKWSSTQSSSFAPSPANETPLYVSDTNGAWRVPLTGAGSYSQDNIVVGIWTGFDCTVNPSIRNDNPNVVVSGRLFKGGDGKLVPQQNYSVILAVEDVAGRIGTTTYTFTVYRAEQDEPEKDEDGKDSTVPQSCDPNEMTGPLGIGEQRYVQSGQWMNYTIYFENMTNATASAQEVRVEHQMSEWLDWSTFEMGEVAFHNQIDMGLAGKAFGVSEA